MQEPTLPVCLKSQYFILTSSRSRGIVYPPFRLKEGIGVAYLNLTGGIRMDLYFGSHKIIDPRLRARYLVSFSIPDIGVRFKAPFPAQDTALDYASLLALLEFVEINPQLFSNRALELYCHNFELVSQINRRFVEDENLAPFLQKALDYRARLRYSLNWVPRPDNPAVNSEND